MLAWFACLGAILCVYREVRKRLADSRRSTPRSNGAASAVASSVEALLAGGTRLSALLGQDIIARTSRFLLVFVVLNGFGLANRATNTVLEAAGATPYVFPLYALQAFFTTCNGLGNALAYGKLIAFSARPREWRAQGAGSVHARKQALLSFRLASSRISSRFSVADESHRNNSGFGSSGAARGARGQARAPPPPPASASLAIFATTWNSGKGPPPPLEEIRSWLPAGRDVYAVGVQECAQLSALSSALREALGGETAYTLHVRCIGSPHVGGYIAIIVLVRTELESSGEFSSVSVAAGAVRRGKKILPKWMVPRAANKGAVGCAFRFHGTTFAFVACHLASDSKGKSKVEKRINDTQSMLEGMEVCSATRLELYLSALSLSLSLPPSCSLTSMPCSERPLRSPPHLCAMMGDCAAGVRRSWLRAPVLMPSRRRPRRPQLSRRATCRRRDTYDGGRRVGYATKRR